MKLFIIARTHYTGSSFNDVNSSLNSTSQYLHRMNIGYYLNKFRVKLDNILENVRQEFEKSDWEVKHRVRATKLGEKVFTRQFALLIDSFNQST